jgi:hypothetical protein
LYTYILYPYSILCFSLLIVKQIGPTKLKVSNSHLVTILNHKKLWILSHHHKLHGSRFDKNSRAKFVFHRFVWNRHISHSSTCIVGTSMSCALFRHKCRASIHTVYIRKSCTKLLCLNNAWHSCVNDTNLWNNRFRMDLEQIHEAYKFVMIGLTLTQSPNSSFNNIS